MPPAARLKLAALGRPDSSQGTRSLVNLVQRGQRPHTPGTLSSPFARCRAIMSGSPACRHPGFCKRAGRTGRRAVCCRVPRSRPHRRFDANAQRNLANPLRGPPARPALSVVGSERGTPGSCRTWTPRNWAACGTPGKRICRDSVTRSPRTGWQNVPRPSITTRGRPTPRGAPRDGEGDALDFLDWVLVWFRAQGIAVRAVMSDNVQLDRSHVWQRHRVRPAALAHPALHAWDQRQVEALQPAAAAPPGVCRRLPVEGPPHPGPRGLAAV